MRVPYDVVKTVIIDVEKVIKVEKPVMVQKIVEKIVKVPTYIVKEKIIEKHVKVPVEKIVKKTIIRKIPRIKEVVKVVEVP